MFKRKGFTLLELIIVVIIIGVLAGIAIPQYLNAVEKAKIAKAKANLTMIAQAEKMYHAENALFTGTSTELEAVVGGGLTGLSSDPDWTFSQTAPTPATFVITATRKAGAYVSKTITLDQTGTMTVDASFP